MGKQAPSRSWRLSRGIRTASLEPDCLVNAGARDLQEANPFDMSMGAKYKVIGVEEIEFDA